MSEENKKIMDAFTKSAFEKAFIAIDPADPFSERCVKYTIVDGVIKVKEVDIKNPLLPK